MSAATLNVLIVEDSEADAQLMVIELQRAGFEPIVVRVETEAEFRVKLATTTDVILSDFRLPRFDALRALRIAREHGQDVPFLIVSRAIGEEAAVRAIQCGATDFLLKNRLDRLGMAVSQAIKQRKLRTAERKETESRARLELALTVAKMGVWEWDLQHDSVNLSRELREILGINDDGGTFAAFQSLFHPEDSDRVMDAVASAVESRTQFVTDFRIIRTTGETRWLSMIGRCETDEIDSPKRLFGTVQDITERKWSENALTENEAQLRGTLNNLLEGCQILDADLRFVYLNANAVRHCRRAAGELIGQRIVDAYPGIDQTPLYTTLRRCLEEQIPADLENRFVFPDGSVGVFDVSILPASEGIVILSYEITERKVAEDEQRQSEQRFRESEERYRLALDAAEQGTWQYDYATNEVWLDEKCRAHNGVSGSLVKPEVAFERMYPGDTEHLISVATAALNDVDGDGSFSSEYRIKHLDGTVKWITLAAKFQFTGVLGKRTPRQIHGTTQDITKRKRAETAVHRQSLVLEQIAIGAPLKSVLQDLVELVEDQLSGSICTIHLVDRKRNLLRFAAGANLPAEFAQTAETLPIGPGVGSCGTAAFLGKPVIVSDIATDPLWADFRDLALQHELRSCWSVPILASSGVGPTANADEVLGTFAVYRHEIATPDPEEELILATVVHLARVAIDRESSFQALRESEARYSAISEITRSVTFAVRYRLDGTSIIEWARPRFGLLSGYTEDECRSRGWAMMFHADDRNRVQDMFRRIATGQVEREEFRYLTKSGQILTVLLQGRFLEWDPTTEEGVIIGGVLDITELKSAERALRASEERFQLALRGANDGLWDWDLTTGHVFFSPRWKSMLGYEDSELIDNFDTWLNLLHPDDRTAAKDRVRDFLNGPRENYESEFRMRHKSGQYLNILARSFATRDAQGSPIRMVGTHQNITERKQADEELRAGRQRLESLSRQLITTREAELRHLARELHDEIGQELTLMKMNLRDIQRTSDEKLRTRLDENISMIERAVNQVRNLSLNMRPPHLDDLGLVATLHWYLKQQAKIAGFQEHISVIPPDIRVPTDLATVCFRISQEAVTNAMRHATPGRIEIELRQRNEELHLTIHDDGIGFDVEEARRLASSGTSLGLTSMHERASLAGGRIEIASTPGQGTTIHAWFPSSPS